MAAYFVPVASIYTFDTERARDLYGKLRVFVVYGDPTAIQVRVQSTNTVYNLTTSPPIPFSIPGHVGCGVHTWHRTSPEVFQVIPLKPNEYITLGVEVDPDPEPEGNGGPLNTGYVIITTPPETGDARIDYKTFIGCGALSNPDPTTMTAYPYFQGDNRSFSNTQGMAWNNGGELGSRVALRHRIEPESGSMLAEKKAFGNTHALSWANTGSPPCDHESPGPFAINQTALQTASIDVDTNPTTYSPVPGLNIPASVTTFHVDAKNPLVPLSCAINADVSVTTYSNGGAIWYLYLGARDAFPSHEMYLNGTSLHQFAPTNPNNGVSLCGGAQGISQLTPLPYFPPP